MLIEYIERMRKQPSDVKKRAVAMWTFSTVAVIVVLYVVYLIVRSTMDDGMDGDTRPTNIAAPYEESQ